MAETTDQLLNDARCIDKCIPPGMRLSVIIAELQQIVATGGAGSGGNSIGQEKVVALGASTNIDWSAAGMFSKTLTGNTTFTFSNLPVFPIGQTIKVEITGNAAATVTWPAVRWPGGVAPVQTLNRVDVYTFITFDGVNIDGSAVQNLS